MTSTYDSRRRRLTSPARSPLSLPAGAKGAQYTDQSLLSTGLAYLRRRRRPSDNTHKASYVFSGHRGWIATVVVSLLLLALPWLCRRAERFVLEQIDAFEWKLEEAARDDY